MSLTEMLTMLSIFLKSPTPGFLSDDMKKKSNCSYKKKKYKFTQGQ